jgi:hypothetical protein
MMLGLKGRGSRGGGVAPTSSGVPHSPQKRIPGAFGVPQLEQTTASRVPHSPQNLRPGSLGVLQVGQITLRAY